MAIIDYPEILVPNSFNLNLKSNSKMYTSSFNMSTNTHRFPGAHWTATLNFDTLDNFTIPEMDILQSFIWSLDGVSGRFRIPIFGKRGAPEVGNPVVNGENQSGGLLSVRGWEPMELVLAKGSYFRIGEELKQVNEDVISNAAGIAIMRFHPWLRSIPSDGDPIVTDAPTGIFRLADNDQGDFSVIEAYQGSVSIAMMEAFNV
ncbi:distal tail protein [Vibrio phage D63]